MPAAWVVSATLPNSPQQVKVRVHRWRNEFCICYHRGVGSQATVHDVNLDEAIARQERVLDLQLAWIAAVDGKTPIVIGMATAMLAALFAVAPGHSTVTVQDGAWLVAGAPLLIACLYNCMRATSPQTDGPVGSMIFFGGIADLPLSQYCEKVGRREKEEHLNDLCRQVHRNACIASHKFRSVQTAMKCLFWGTGPWLVACYFLYKG